MIALFFSLVSATALGADCDAASTGAASTGGVSYATIQDAVDAATSGATVEICAGTWFENVVVDHKTLTLEGEGADLSILDGSDAASVVTAQHGADLTVRSLTVQHGSNALDGGGIDARGADWLTVEDAVVSENHADRNGGGIQGPGLGSSQITRTLVSDNDAGGSGGGASFANRDGYWTGVSDSEFRGNHADGSGGGITFGTSRYMGHSTLIDTIVDGNSAGGNGGGVWVDTSFFVERAVISNNTAANGGGVSVSMVNVPNRSGVTVDDETEIFGNATATGGAGGGVYFASGQRTKWNGGHVHDNTAGYGGGIYASFSGEGRVLYAVVEGNHATVAGGGVWLAGDIREVQNVTVRDNESDGTGGGFYLAKAAIPGWNYRYVHGIRFENCLASGNVATAGGGIMSESDFQSVHSSWGADSSDNTPDDVGLVDAGTTATFGGFGRAENFACEVGTTTCMDR